MTEQFDCTDLWIKHKDVGDWYKVIGVGKQDSSPYPDDNVKLHFVFNKEYGEGAIISYNVGEVGCNDRDWWLVKSKTKPVEMSREH